MQVSKWGDSLAVRLPKALVEKMGLSAGDELTIVDVVERTLVVQKEDRRKAALERLASLNGRSLPITNSTGTRRMSVEGFLRFQHPRRRAWIISENRKLRLTPPANHRHIPPRPVPPRGVSGSSETRGGMRWTRQRQA